MIRKIYADLLRWKSDSQRKPLIIRGARQVGKTWIMKEFGRCEYEDAVYINCDNEERMKPLLELDYRIDRIIMGLQAISQKEIIPQKTLIILDEIQEVPRGLHLLKYFCEDAPEYHVMVAGSLLGIALGQNTSFPVGKVDLLNMYPMDFNEFLNGIGESCLNDLLHAGDPMLIDSMSLKLIDLLRQYYFVGGMPEVVASFASEKDLKKVRTLQSGIIATYRNDISKHTTKRESVRIGQILDSLVSQLAKENKKFIYGALKAGARAADYELAIQWLTDAGIVHKVTRVKEPKLPLKFYEDCSAFKLFMLDCGLLACMSDAPAGQMLFGDSVFTEFKGSFTEQYVLQQMIACGIKPYYWTNSKTPAEIDFIWQHEDDIIPTEVKAEENVRSKSLRQFVTEHPSLKGLRLSMKGFRDQGWMRNVPLYAINAFIEEMKKNNTDSK